MLAHPAWPLRFAAGGGFVLVDQDSLQDLEASAAIIACTRRGHREDDPSFGITPMEFQQGDLQLERFSAELAASDGRLNVDAEETLDLAASTIRLVQANIGDA